MMKMPLKEADYILTLVPVQVVHGGEYYCARFITRHQMDLWSAFTITGKYISGEEFIVIPKSEYAQKNRKG